MVEGGREAERDTSAYYTRITVHRNCEPVPRVQAGLVKAEEGPEVRGSEVHLSEDVSRGGKFDLKLLAAVCEEGVT